VAVGRVCGKAVSGYERGQKKSPKSERVERLRRQTKLIRYTVGKNLHRAKALCVGCSLVVVMFPTGDERHAF